MSVKMNQSITKNKTGSPSAKRGKDVLADLQSQGIEAGNVTRQRTGIYAVEFRAPNPGNMGERGTDPARVWARRIEARFDGIEIVDTYDSVADWRPQRPVLFATVFLRGTPTPKAS